MKRSIILLAVFMFIVSCSKKESNSSSTLKEVQKQNEALAQEIEELQETDNQVSRSLKMADLASKKTNLSEKIAAASLYFKSFNFDNKNTRDKKLVAAANDFSIHIAGIYEDVNLKKMSPTEDGKSQSAEMAIYALAMTMHMNHHYENNFLDASAGSKGTSFYDVIRKAISKESSGERLEDHEDVLLSGRNKEIIIELIKARVDIMSTFALKNLTDERDMSFFQKFKLFLLKKLKVKLGSIKIPETFTKANEPTKKQTVGYLSAAMKAKSFLDKQRIEKHMEDTLKAAFSEIKLGEMPREDVHPDNVVEVGETKEESDQRKVEIRSLIDGLLR